MTTRKQIIAQIDVELTRLERVRDLLEAAVKDARIRSKAVLAVTKAKAKQAAKAPVVKTPVVQMPAKKRKRPVAAATTPVSKVEVQVTAEPPPPPAAREPEIKRLPPRRRSERRHVQADKAGKSAAALSGAVPPGPVVVSKDEARKHQERAAAQPAPAPQVSELRPENPGERSLSSLIQAFERRSGLSGLETNR
jgi:hypothetical protein